MLLFGVVLAVAFIEVWESTAVSQLTLEIDRLEVELREADARQSYLDARAAASGSRVRLASIAERLDLRPADPGQVVVIPREYLGAAPVKGRPEHGLAAATRRASEILVPAARARERRASTE
jgi:cell division protein FtsL